MKVYILSTFQEDGAEEVKATLYKSHVIDMFKSYNMDPNSKFLARDDEVVEIEKLLEIDKPNPSGYSIGKGWGGYMLHIIELDEPPRCEALIWHGPGHQSRTRCYLKGKHEIHETRYGRYDQIARWKGDKALSGFADEPPDEPEDEEDGRVPES